MKLEVQSIEPTPATSGRPILILGYGNTLRGDDGVGPRVVEAVAELKIAGVESNPCPQLTLELADPISRARFVIFVDAALDSPRQVQWHSLEAAHSSQVLGHHVDPATLLALARDLFDIAPPAWLVTIPIESTAIGEELSPLARRGCSMAIEQILRFVRATAA